MKFTLDCFTGNTVGTNFPENTYEAFSVQEVADIIHNCSREEAGIVQVQVWVDVPHNDEPIEGI